MFTEVKAEQETSAADFCGDELTSWGLFACLVRSSGPPAEWKENHTYLRPRCSCDKRKSWLTFSGEV